MSNIFRSCSNAPKEEWLSISNQGTDCFLELLIRASSGIETTEKQKELIDFLEERRYCNNISPGTVSFDVDEMPWNKETMTEDVGYMLKVIDKAKDPQTWNGLDYEPNKEIVIPWFERFAKMIRTLSI